MIGSNFLTTFAPSLLLSLIICEPSSEVTQIGERVIVHHPHVHRRHTRRLHMHMPHMHKPHINKLHMHRPHLHKPYMHRPNVHLMHHNKSEFFFRDTSDIIEDFGYCSETHTVTTEDGYSLKLYRVVDSSCPSDRISSIARTGRRLGRKRKQKKDLARPAVMLVHGLLGSSSDYVIAGIGKALGFHLLSKGFDVWLTNFRGNIFGGYENKTEAFWDFSFDEMGEFDLPAHIDYILDKTKQKKLFYVGFSMGTTAAYVMLCKKPDYNDKIERMISLAPVVFTKFTKRQAPLKAMEKGMKVQAKTRLLFRSDSYPRSPVPFSVFPNCLKPSIRAFCERRIRHLSSQPDSDLYDEDMRIAFWKVTPVGASWKTLAHYFQMMESGVFGPFSYGLRKNRMVYKGDEPLPYNMSNVRIPIRLIIGKSDMFSTKENILNLQTSLRSAPSVDVIYIANDGFNHIDFFTAKNVNELLFDKVSSYLKN